MLPQEIIRKKRDKQNLSAEEIDFFVRGVTDGTIADCQIGSFTMAAFLNGLDAGETKNLTLAMRDSGDVLQWPELDAPVVDKHSSGGVGDKVSLMLAPMLAAAGVYVPMISGRGLGHTGGTLDKFDSVPGYQTHPDNDLFRAAVKEVGCAVIGQTGSLAPADKKIYAVRDVSATVESIPLITASILSKKLAAGLDCLIMDLKFGNGAFMESIDDGRALARSIVSVAGKAGTKTKALLTDMNQVLGTTAGNAVEVKEAVDYLKGINVDPRLHEITLRLAAELLVTAGCFADAGEARKRLLADLDSGRSPEVFARMVKKLGGPRRLCRMSGKIPAPGSHRQTRFSALLRLRRKHEHPQHRPQHHRPERRPHLAGTKAGLRHRLHRLLSDRRLCRRAKPAGVCPCRKRRGLQLCRRRTAAQYCHCQRKTAD